MPPAALALTDPDTGSTARILAGYGWNLCSYEVAWRGGRRELVWTEPGFAEAPRHPSLSGIPILFPFAGRLRGRTLTFEERTYQLPGLDDGRGNAIHGFVLDRPWQVVEHAPHRAVGRFHAARAAPELRDAWPSDFALTASYELRGGRLRAELIVDNPGERTLPFSLGAHPYLRVPLADGGAAEACRLAVPAATSWELADLLPTGRELPAHGERDLREGRALGELHLDDVLGGLAVSDGAWRARLSDPGGRAVDLVADAAFAACVVYDPPHREAVCVEPYTAVPDAFTLAARGLAGGLRVLPPGGSFRTWFELVPAA